MGGSASFPKAYIYSDILSDSQIVNEQLKGDWQKINFLVVDASMLREIRDGGRYALLDQALHHAILRVSFGSDKDGTQMQIYQVMLT